MFYPESFSLMQGTDGHAAADKNHRESREGMVC